jgi:hypothetical protein
VDDDELQGSYTRFAIQCLKVAMLLATMDAEQLPVRVALRHWARAQQIVEGWRASLHELRRQGIATDEERLAHKPLARLDAVRPAGKTARELSQELHQASAVLLQVLNLLLDAGQGAKTSAERKTLWYRPDERMVAASGCAGPVIRVGATQSSFSSGVAWRTTFAPPASGLRSNDMGAMSNVWCLGPHRRSRASSRATPGRRRPKAFSGTPSNIYTATLARRR